MLKYKKQFDVWTIGYVNQGKFSRFNGRKRGLSPTLSENAIGCDMEVPYI